jgi:hypothetical protein
MLESWKIRPKFGTMAELLFPTAVAHLGWRRVEELSCECYEQVTTIPSD